MSEISIRPATIDDAKALTDLAYTTFWDAFAHHPKNAPDDLNHYMRQAFNLEQISAELEDDKSIFLIAEIEGMGRRAMGVQLDVSRIDEIAPAVDAVAERFGGLDILVNNAGLGPSNLAVDVTEADYDLTMTVNVKGTFFTSQAVGRVMIGQGSGRIINLSSQAGFIALPTESVYCASKAAIAHLTKCLAVEWGEHGITVNAVAPGVIETEMSQAVRDVAGEQVQSRILLRRFGSPQEVAFAVWFLASKLADYITGQVLHVDGGFKME